MKNWQTLDADVNKLLTKHYTIGRQGHHIKYVVVHHNAGNLTVDGCYSVWQTRQASAHYQVQADGTIGQLVWDRDTAWHAGNWTANLDSIGVEHADTSNGAPYQISSAALDNGAHLVAAICRHYKLGRPQWFVNVYPHSHFTATGCPASIFGSQRDEYMQRCQYWYDQMTGSTAAPAPNADQAPMHETITAGRYVCRVAGLNVRTQPSTKAQIVASYANGNTVVLDGWTATIDGYVWGRYIGASSGQYRYVALGPVNNNRAYLTKA